ncbi:hypothetical protein KR044_010658, partial [Drosophila immigrans]
MAGMIPVDILAMEMREVYVARKEMSIGESVEVVRQEKRRTSLQVWQTRWDATTKGRWTYRLIPRVADWIGRRGGHINFHITQFITGHGGYRKYLFKYRHEDSPECPNCPDSEEDPEHVLYHCPRYSWMFQHPRPPEDLINYMLETEENWRNTCQLITGIQSDLRRCEKERRVRES